MLKGALQRAAVAIVLMGTLSAPFGRCFLRTHESVHSCCAPAPEPIAQTNCCIASAPLPAAVVTPNLPGPTAIVVAQEFISSDELSSLNECPRSAATPPQSPPTGAFVLRI
jgi:hypothetical protein